MEELLDDPAEVSVDADFDFEGDCCDPSYEPGFHDSICTILWMNELYRQGLHCPVYPYLTERQGRGRGVA